METVFYQRKKPLRSPAKVVSFEEYCRGMDSSEEERASIWEKGLRRRGKRRILELICLLLEAGVCLTMLILMFATIVRLLSR